MRIRPTSNERSIMRALGYKTVEELDRALAAPEDPSLVKDCAIEDSKEADDEEVDTVEIPVSKSRLRRSLWPVVLGSFAMGGICFSPEESMRWWVGICLFVFALGWAAVVTSKNEGF